MWRQTLQQGQGLGALTQIRTKHCTTWFSSFSMAYPAVLYHCLLENFFFFFKLQLLLLLSLNPQIKNTSCTFPMNQGKPTVLAKLLRCRNKQDVCNTQKGPAMNKDKIWVWKAYLRRGGKLPRCRNCWHVLTHAHLSLWQEVWGFRSLSFRLLFWFLQSNFN